MVTSYDLVDEWRSGSKQDYGGRKLFRCLPFITVEGCCDTKKSVAQEEDTLVRNFGATKKNTLFRSIVFFITDCYY